MKVKTLLLATGLIAATLGMASCSEAESFDPINPIIYLESGAENENGTEEAPAWDIGFEPINVSDVGPRN